MKKNHIFVQIAAYCDSELVPTVLDLIENAKNPENLKICIAWQHRPDEEIDDIKDLDCVDIIDIPHVDTQGVCWARNAIQQRWDKEEYTLHLDSHHRFVKDWDEKCINMFKVCQSVGYEKPILTAYLPTYEPWNDPKGRDSNAPWCLHFDRFTPEGAIFMKNQAMTKEQQESFLPLRTRFFSAHFAFTLGKFCTEVPHDPNYWFHGEEISIAVRAFTHGYDLFCPNEIIAYHEYLREYRGPKVWDEQPHKTTTRNTECHKRNQKLLGIDNVESPEELTTGKYGFGTVRTKQDYEKYAGIRFADRSVQQSTIDNIEPAYSDTGEEYKRIFKHYVDIPKDIFASRDHDFCVLAFEDENNTEIYREDISKSELDNLLTTSDNNKWHHIPVLREFHALAKPHKAIVWPYSVSKEWEPRVELSLV